MRGSGRERFPEPRARVHGPKGLELRATYTARGEGVYACLLRRKRFAARPSPELALRNCAKRCAERGDTFGNRLAGRRSAWLADVDHRAADVEAQHLTVGGPRVLAVKHGGEGGYHQDVGPKEERRHGRDIGRTSVELLTAGDGRSSGRRALVRERRTAFERVRFPKRHEPTVEPPRNARAYAAAPGCAARTARRKTRGSVGRRSLALRAARGSLFRGRGAARVGRRAVWSAARFELTRAVKCTRPNVRGWIFCFFGARPACGAPGDDRSNDEPYNARSGGL
jgi:hypothetical protein